jgi:RNA polymerase sigma-70 factor (ECF subfamily)
MAKNPKITEEEIALIKSAQAGDISAYNKLYYKYEKFTTNLLYRYIKDYDEARDINNIVWLKVYNKLSKFVDYSSFGGWLRVLTNRIAVDYLRESKPDFCVPESTGPCVFDLTQDVSCGESTVDEISYNQIIEEFKQFPEDVRRVFELHYVDHLTVSEISKQLKMPEGTIKSHLSRRRKQLKKQLKL